MGDFFGCNFMNFLARWNYSFYFLAWPKQPFKNNFWFQKNHGGPASEDRHVGDLGNINTEDGHAIVQIVDLQAKLSGEYSIMNRSIVIHEGEDDLGASGDSAGAAGSRLACCIIEPEV